MCSSLRAGSERRPYGRSHRAGAPVHPTAPPPHTLMLHLGSLDQDAYGHIFYRDFVDLLHPPDPSGVGKGISSPSRSPPRRRPTTDGQGSPRYRRAEVEVKSDANLNKYGRRSFSPSRTSRGRSRSIAWEEVGNVEGSPKGQRVATGAGTEDGAGYSGTGKVDSRLRDEFMMDRRGLTDGGSDPREKASHRRAPAPKSSVRMGDREGGMRAASAMIRQRGDGESRRSAVGRPMFRTTHGVGESRRAVFFESGYSRFGTSGYVCLNFAWLTPTQRQPVQCITRENVHERRKIPRSEHTAFRGSVEGGNVPSEVCLGFTRIRPSTPVYIMRAYYPPR